MSYLENLYAHSSSVGWTKRRYTNPMERTRIRQPGGVRLYAEVGVTLQVAEFHYLKFTYGQEMIAPNDDPATIKKLEDKLFKRCEAVVNRRAEQLRKAIEE